MGKCVINLEYFTALHMYIAGIEHASLAYNRLGNLRPESHVKSLFDSRKHVERAKAARDTLRWTKNNGVDGLRKSLNALNNFLKNNPLPWYLIEHLEYVTNEVTEFALDVIDINKNPTLVSRAAGSKD